MNSELARKPPPPHIPANVTGGSGKAPGVTTVIAGLGLFWYAQQWMFRKKREIMGPVSIPTWEYRMRQQPSPMSYQRMSGSNFGKSSDQTRV
ncbi:uncharacterized protein LAESUDRAFT_761635 [Laetiporus sulphureus 93-53]|uniref:Uncharacterized protein n=1 Tax=Laetiporus sulphureus 93-53 TaxID=1314785 RepID=A0A165CZ46_9APHY|nr:uncharacterized protein LAESUDRAFT_761635 [Laetiporus sulphureus 93-53]KZT03788.1 hypothetical protein LAESUDRAFT_761635 [Laetiporus sulphureus 93-53]